MTRRWLAALALAFLATCAQAESPAPRMISDDEAPAWRALGRLHVAGNRFCTATLIAPDEVITAAHCLYHPVTLHRAEPQDIRFVAGFRRESYAALRGVAAVAVLPGYVFEGLETKLTPGSMDLALLRLDKPITTDEAPPLAVADWPNNGGVLDIAGYGRDRPLIAAIRQGCPLVNGFGHYMQLDCPVVPGLSGAPVLATGGQEVVAVVSLSVGTRVQGNSTLVVPLMPHIAALRALLEE